MPARTTTFDLRSLKLLPGAAKVLELSVALGTFDFGRDHYDVIPDPAAVRLDVSRMTGDGYALRLRFEAGVHGPCMRCLQPAVPVFEVDAREVSAPGGGEELQCEYLDGDEVLDVAQWAHDAFALALPQTIVCREACAGLCAQCGADLNLEPDHEHERPPDPRWAKLRELELE